MKFIDLTGQKFDRLTVLSRAENIRGRGAWLCLCKCGKTKVIRANHLRRGLVSSCGCKLKEARFIKHGKTRKGKKHPLYNTWSGIKDRCYNPNNQNYEIYGGRGITVCQRWLNNFGNFLADMGERPTPQHTVERIDNDSGYSPSNCRWATMTEQARNRRNSKMVPFQGRIVTVAEAAELSGIPAPTIYSRLSRGADPIHSPTSAGED